MKRWKFDDPALLYLYPATYALHLLEEWAAAAPIVHWGVRADRPLDPVVFVGANVFGLVLMAAGIRLSQRHAVFAWVVPALAVAVFLNTTGHVVGSITVRGYSAGLITAIVFWIPLALLTLLRVWDQAAPRTLAAGAACGAFVELIVAATLPLVSGAH